MKVVVETLGTEIISDYCFKGYIGATNNGHAVEKLSLTKASMEQNRLLQDMPMPIGSVGYMEWFFNLYGIEKPKPISLPKVLEKHIERTFWTVKSKSELTYPEYTI